MKVQWLFGVQNYKVDSTKNKSPFSLNQQQVKIFFCWISEYTMILIIDLTMAQDFSEICQTELFKFTTTKKKMILLISVENTWIKWVISMCHIKSFA